MKRIKRIVDTSFWSDEKVLNFSPEDKYFWLFLLTNEYSTQLGIYYLPIKKAAFDLGYSIETVQTLLDRFSNEYGLIIWGKDTDEVAIKNYLLYSIVKGGKPVFDCLVKDQLQVKDKSLLVCVRNHLRDKEIDNDTVNSYLDYLDSYLKDNNINDNDNERIVDESWTNRQNNEKSRVRAKSIPKEKPRRNIIPPDIEWVREYCNERQNGIDAEHFVNYYESKGWLIGKTKMKDWEASVRTWERTNNAKKPVSRFEGLSERLMRENK